MIKKLLTFMALAVTLTACAGSSEKATTAIDSTKTTENTKMEPTTDKYVLVKTSLGDITLRLYGDTPKHQANFLKLVKEGYYNNVLFHRVINEFMIQTGDPDSRDAKAGQMLGSGGPGYEIDAEIDYPKHFHKRGALAAARSGDQVNPMRRSSGSQFYIVTGKTFSDAELAQLAARGAQDAKQQEFYRLANQHMDEIRKMQTEGDNAGLRALQEKLIAEVEAKFADTKTETLPADQIEAYKTVGGAPHLDGQYTVFGEVVSGMDVVDKIEKAETDRNDRPTSDIRIISASVIDAPGK